MRLISVSPTASSWARLVVRAGVLVLVVGGTAGFVVARSDTSPESVEVVAQSDPASVLRDELYSTSRSFPVRTELRAPVSVTVGVDGVSIELSTSAPTVRDVLLGAGVVLGEHDLVSVPLEAPITSDLVIEVTRVETVVVSQEVPLEHETVRQNDSSLSEGTEEVVTTGRDGVAVVVAETYMADGVEVGRTVLARSVVTPAVDEVIRVGTGQAVSVPASSPVTPGTARAIGLQMVLDHGWSESEFACLDALWTRESNWRVNASNGSSGAYGIPQALPGSKMASAGPDWQTNPATQIAWGLGYVSGRYGTPCGAWSFFQSHNWY